MCTIEGARALGLEGRIGTLEPGKDADLCAVAFEAPRTRPVFTPEAALFHAARGSDVILTVVQGAILYEGGRHSTVDVAGVARAIEDVGSRLREALTG